MSEQDAADTNPLREKLRHCLCDFVPPYATQTAAVNTMTRAIERVLAEFIGDGLLDKHGQRVKLREVYVSATSISDDESQVAVNVFDPETNAEVDPDLRLFVLERSETDQ